VARLDGEALDEPGGELAAGLVQLTPGAGAALEPGGLETGLPAGPPTADLSDGSHAAEWYARRPDPPANPAFADAKGADPPANPAFVDATSASCTGEPCEPASGRASCAPSPASRG